MSAPECLTEKIRPPVVPIGSVNQSSSEGRILLRASESVSVRRRSCSAACRLTPSSGSRSLRRCCLRSLEPHLQGRQDPSQGLRSAWFLQPSRPTAAHQSSYPTAGLTFANYSAGFAIRALQSLETSSDRTSFA